MTYRGDIYRAMLVNRSQPESTCFRQGSLFWARPKDFSMRSNSSAHWAKEASGCSYSRVSKVWMEQKAHSSLMKS